jgi:hypothetical protein
MYTSTEYGNPSPPRLPEAWAGLDAHGCPWMRMILDVARSINCETLTCAKVARHIASPAQHDSARRIPSSFIPAEANPNCTRGWSMGGSSTRLDAPASSP